MIYLYKNFLIIDRNETEVQSNHNINFTDGDNVWHVKSDQDKIIIVYGSELIQGNKIHVNGVVKNNISPIGYIKIYCQNTKVKVSDINFRNEVDAKKYLNMFKSYLKESIKNIGLSAQKIDSEKFVLYWSKIMYNQDVERILKELDFISNTSKKTYNYTSNVVLNVVLNVNHVNVGGFNTSFGTSSTKPDVTPSFGGSYNFGTSSTKPNVRPSFGGSYNFGTFSTKPDVTPSFGGSFGKNSLWMSANPFNKN